MLFLWQKKKTWLENGILLLRKSSESSKIFLSCPHIYTLIIADTFYFFFLLYCSYIKASARVSERCKKKKQRNKPRNQKQKKGKQK